ncbi:MAG: hypothetical protein QXE05_08910 [Nitrososphaeria archaeon]
MEISNEDYEMIQEEVSELYQITQLLLKMMDDLHTRIVRLEEKIQ